MKAIKKLALSCLVLTPIKMLAFYIRMIGLIHIRFKNELKDLLASEVNERTKTLTHKAMSGRVVEMSLYTPNSMCSFRSDTFSTKEPETLEWIERFGGKEKKILFDIGANIGIYSIYHSLLNGGRTISFEPSFFNLKQIAKNISLNKCENLISVIPNALSSSSCVSELLYQSTDEGGALSAFGVEYGYGRIQATDRVRFREKLKPTCKTKVAGFSLDDLFEWGLLEDKPNLIKIDVDGIEDLILEGSVNTLSSDECVSVLVEVDLGRTTQYEKMSNILLGCGFRLREAYGSHNNQVWVK